jgi:hypothetical protein
VALHSATFGQNSLPDVLQRARPNVLTEGEASREQLKRDHADRPDIRFTAVRLHYHLHSYAVSFHYYGTLKGKKKTLLGQTSILCILRYRDNAVLGSLDIDLNGDFSRWPSVI